MKRVVSEISGTVFSLPWLIAKDDGLSDEIVEDTYHWMVR